MENLKVTAKEPSSSLHIHNIRNKPLKFSLFVTFVIYYM